MPYKTKEEKNRYHKEYYQRLKSGEITARGTRPVKDILDKVFGCLTAVKFVNRRGVLQRPFWEFKCTCGKIKTLAAADVVAGKTKSCGHLHTDGHPYPHALKVEIPEKAARRNCYMQYQYGSRTRGLDWSLTEEQFNLLTTSNCYLCGVCPSQVHKIYTLRKTVTHTCLINGIDRLDNSRGYTPDNVKACCKRCNIAKHNMTQEQFNEWLSRLVAFQNRESSD